MSGGSLPQPCAVAEADRIGRGVSATNMVKVTGNGTKRRINGSKLRRDDPYKKSNTYVTDKGVTSEAPRKNSLDKYFGEQLVGYMGLMLLMAAGWQLATISADSAVMMWGQRLGFVASTVFIMILKHKLSKGEYLGPQRRLAQRLFKGGVAFESFTLLAKYFSALVPGYLFLVGFTIPGLIIAAFEIMNKDSDKRLRVLQKENEALEIQLREEKNLLTIKNDLIKQLADLRSKEVLYEVLHDVMLKGANSGSSKRQVKQVGKSDLKLLVGQVKKESTSKTNKTKQLSEAKVVGESHTRKRKGPSNNPDNPNAPKCKNPNCNTPLTGSQKVTCGQSKCRTKVSRLVKAGKLEKTW